VALAPVGSGGRAPDEEPRAASVSTAMSASSSCTSWNEAMGRPNWRRSFA
jgi:hypothetical protein